MRIRQMGFSSRLVAHRNLLTLETLKFIVEYLIDGNATEAARRSGIPGTYASRQGQWLKKLPMVKQALANDLNERDLKSLQRSIARIEEEMRNCREILGVGGEAEPREERPESLG
jgi:phage terminase small subunit